MSRMLKVPEGPGHHEVFSLGEAGVRWLGLELLRLMTGETWRGQTGEQEAAFVILGGRCRLRVRGKHEEQWEGLGARGDIFAGPPTAAYVPRRAEVEVAAETKLEVAIAKAPCEMDLPPNLILPQEVKVVSAGMASWRRDVRMIIPPGSTISQRMIVGETINPPGNWSGIPPHKHDVKSETENILEEFYLFKTRPADGYGIQLMNDQGQDTAHVIYNDHVAVLQNGYHPTCAAPGVTVAYLWVLAGDSKAYDISIDPRFAWVGQAEAVLRELQQR